MRILYCDCFSGASGDMILGALLDCGIEFEAFKKELDKLKVEGYSIEVSRTAKNGISAMDVNVILEEHDHHHDHEHENEHHGHHEHRNLEDIEDIIDKSELSSNVKDTSKRIFKKLALAEAKVHGKTVHEIHFHEVGAVDSIIDIVGASICFDMLKIDKFIASPVNTGMGFVKCQHGIIPVPGPAAIELLKGFPIYSMDINTELITPTGAAILSTLCESFGPIPSMVIENTGYGAGKKNLDIPNLIRLIIGDEKKKMTAHG